MLNDLSLLENKVGFDPSYTCLHVALPVQLIIKLHTEISVTGDHLHFTPMDGDWD